MEIRRAREEDLSRIQTFIAETYGSTTPFKGEARWRWQFLDAPARPEGDTGPTVWIADDNGRVAGQIAVQDGALWLGGQQYDAGWIVDVMVHPDYRGQGLGHRIHEAVAVDRATLVTLTMAPATRRMAEKASCVTLGEASYHLLPLRLSGTTVARFVAYKTAHKARLAPIARLFNATRVGPALLGTVVTAAARRRGRGATAFDIEEVAAFPPEMDAFWERVKPAYPAVFERTAAFLNWRYQEVPDLAYRCFLLRKDGEMRGYLVTRRGHQPAELPLGVIADMLVAPEDHAALDALVAQARKTLAPDCEYIEAGASTPAYRAALDRAGFRVVRRHAPTVVTSDPDVRRLAETHRDDWHFTKADHDWDQVHPI